MNQSIQYPNPRAIAPSLGGRHGRRPYRRLVPLVVLALLLCACSFSRAQAPEESYKPVRSPYPTFTPTPVAQPLPGAGTDEDAGDGATTANAAEAAPVDPAPIASDTPSAAESPTEVAAAPTPEPTAAPPRLVISSPLVNVRAGPGTGFAVITTVERGQEYDIVAKNAAGDWWRFCCIDQEPAWVIGELVEVDGAVDTVPVSDAVVAVAATATPAQVAAPPAPAEPTATEPPPPPAFGFELQNAEQFPENKLVRVFLYVFDNDQALGGYTVRVTKDGAELPVSAASAAGQPGLTWPIADSRQRFQNMKVEFPGIQPAGTWVVQLVDGGGSAVGPPATFNLAANDPGQELYVRYKKQ